MKNILDSDLGQEINTLSNFQLVGFLYTKVKFDEKLLEDIRIEITRRNLSESEISKISNELNQEILIPKGKFSLGYLNIFFTVISLFLSLFLHPFLFVIIGFSIFALRIRFEKGVLSENRLWNKFSIIMGIVLCSLISVLHLLNMI